MLYTRIYELLLRFGRASHKNTFTLKKHLKSNSIARQTLRKYRILVWNTRFLNAPGFEENAITLCVTEHTFFDRKKICLNTHGRGKQMVQCTMQLIARCFHWSKTYLQQQINLVRNDWKTKENRFLCSYRADARVYWFDSNQAWQRIDDDRT